MAHGIWPPDQSIHSGLSKIECLQQLNVATKTNETVYSGNVGFLSALGLASRKFQDPIVFSRSFVIMN
jgi:hypothetical protein